RRRPPLPHRERFGARTGRARPPGERLPRRPPRSTSRAPFHAQPDCREGLARSPVPPPAPALPATRPADRRSGRDDPPPAVLLLSHSRREGEHPHLRRGGHVSQHFLVVL